RPSFLDTRPSFGATMATSSPADKPSGANEAGEPQPSHTPGGLSWNSLMGQLLRQYVGNDRDEDASISNNVVYFSNCDLEPQNIVDTGNRPLSNRTRFRLTDEYYKFLVKTMDDLQETLNQAGQLIGRTMVYQVDPKLVFHTIFKGTKDLPSLNVAWNGIQTWFSLGNEHLYKYANQYDSDDILTSPVSTAPELYSPLSRIKEDGEKLRYLYSNIPHHCGQLDEAQQARLNTFVHWDSVVPLPDILDRAF
ncbi:hypothetical protein EV421DRAFT_1674816, partial [Armillaria borealis]